VTEATDESPTATQPLPVVPGGVFLVVGGAAPGGQRAPAGRVRPRPGRRRHRDVGTDHLCGDAPPRPQLGGHLLHPGPLTGDHHRPCTRGDASPPTTRNGAPRRKTLPHGADGPPAARAGPRSATAPPPPPSRLHHIHISGNQPRTGQRLPDHPLLRSPPAPPPTHTRPQASAPPRSARSHGPRPPRLGGGRGSGREDLLAGLEALAGGERAGSLVRGALTRNGRSRTSAWIPSERSSSATG
jgi:hypothetical protein